MEPNELRPSDHLKKQFIRILAVAVLLFVFFAAKSLIPGIDETKTSVAGHAQLKLNKKLEAVHGEPSETEGFSTLQGEITKVVDGDTADFLMGNGRGFRVRLLGVAAPKPQMGSSGSSSKGNLLKLLGKCSNFVKLNFRDDDNRDNYGRLVAKVLCDGNDINLEMISSGHAWLYPEEEKELMPGDLALYQEAQANAKEKKLGLWANPHPTKPWEWVQQESKTSDDSYLVQIANWIKKVARF